MRNWSATGACDTQFVVNVSAPNDTLRCKRHQAIYGEKWPYREKGVFTDLSSTTSDGEESSSSSSEGSAPIRSNRLLKKRRAEKAAQFAASAASALHAGNPTRPRIPSRGRNGEVARRARRGQKSTKSESEDSSSPEPQPSRRKPRKQATSPQARKNISATVGKAKEKVAEPLSKKRRVTINAIANHVATTAASAASNKKKGDVGTPNEMELARAARARARLLLKDNPDLDLDEIKVAAAAGVMRSGRARGAATEKMPVTGPPIAMMPKRKRAAISDDCNEDDTLHMPTRRTARISSAKSEPRPPSKNQVRKMAANTSPRKTHTSMLGPKSSASANRAKIKLRSRSGSRWGDPDDGSSNESEVGDEKEMSPSLAVRRPLLSFTPNPAFFAMRKRALSDPAAVVKSHNENSSSLSSSPALAPVSRARVKIIISDLSSDGTDGQLSEDEHSAPQSSTILHLSSSYIPHAKDALSDAMDISDIELSNALSESPPVVAPSLMQDDAVTMDADVTVYKIEPELTPDMDGISSDLTQASAPSLTSSVPSSSSSTTVGTPQVPLVTETVIIRDDSPSSTTSSPSQASKKGNVRTYQTWKRSHLSS